MADTTPAPDAHADTSADPAAASEPLGGKGLDALHKERSARRAAEARARELEPLAARARELEDATKTEAQRAADALAAATRRAETAEAHVLRHEVAAAAGLPAGWAARLVGGTREELEADAAELAARLAPADPGARPLAVRPDPTQGGATTGGSVPLNGDPLLRALTTKLGIR